MAEDLRIGCIRPGCDSGQVAHTRRLCRKCFRELAQDVALFKTTWAKLEKDGICGPLNQKTGWHAQAKQTWEQRQNLIKDRWAKIKEKEPEKEEPAVSDDNGTAAATVQILTRKEKGERIEKLLREIGPSYTAKEVQGRLKEAGVEVSLPPIHKWKQKVFGGGRAPSDPAVPKTPKARTPGSAKGQLVPARTARLQASTLSEIVAAPATAPRIRFKLIDVEIEGAALPADLLAAVAQAFGKKE